MKRYRFPKGIKVVNYPFHLNPYQSWQDQVSLAIEKCTKEHGVSKRMEWGFLIQSFDLLIVQARKI